MVGIKNNCMITVIENTSGDLLLGWVGTIYCLSSLIHVLFCYFVAFPCVPVKAQFRHPFV